VRRLLSILGFFSFAVAVNAASEPAKPLVDPKGVHEVIWAFLPAMIARASR
jgi:hypothetical protein